jgi:hypothetical protein
MTPTLAPPRFRWNPKVLALAVLLVMAAHTYVKWRLGTLPELLWGCNVASFALVVGLWIGNAPMVGMAFLWHLCVGDPAYVAGALQQGSWGWSSILAHSLPPLAGLAYLLQEGLPRSSPYLALLLFVALVPVSHYLTPAALNINLAHQRLGFLQRRFPGPWSYRLAFSAGMLSLLLLGDAALALWLKRPEVIRRSGASL